MDLDKAVEAAARVLNDVEENPCLRATTRGLARIAVEAAAEHLMPRVEPGPEIRCGDDLIESLDDVRSLAARAERAEALADRLAEALRNCLHWSNEDGNAALDAWKEARSES